MNAARFIQTLSACNVVPFPRAQRVKAPKGRRSRAGKASNVLKFTGKKRYVYEREALLGEFQEGMKEMAKRFLDAVSEGKLTGALLITSTGGQNDTSWAEAIGLFKEDLEHTAEVLEGSAEHVRGILERDE